jgi:hypothetical protein
VPATPLPVAGAPSGKVFPLPDFEASALALSPSLPVLLLHAIKNTNTE